MKQELAFFNTLVEKLLEQEKDEAVAKPIPPNDLTSKLNVEFSDEGLSTQEWENIIEKVMKHTPKTASKLFFNQLFGGRQPKAVLGELLAVMLNNSMYTYKVAGPQVGIEKAIMHKVCSLIGYEHGDGTIAPGGSMANFMGMIMGRDAKNATSPTEGVNTKMTLYTSIESHYSIPKNAAFMGVGRDHVRYVRTDDEGKMDPNHLEALIEEDSAKGFTPFMVNATAGTTVLGAFDDIEALSSVCKRHNLWLHVDGAYCGAVIFSEQYKHLVNGIELSDSFSFNAHKMLGTPLSCSIFVTKHRDGLYKSFSNEAEYLYQTDADDYDLGKISLQCGRRNDALKFWTLWKAVGNKGLEEMVDHQFYLADVAREYCSNHPDYTLYSFDDSVSICFNYKGIDARALCTHLYDQALAMVGYGKFREDEFVRLVTINAANDKEDILHFFKTLEEGAKDLV
jgi:sulfinoalanine decarboxylase